jgi:hypothetical protein
VAARTLAIEGWAAGTDARGLTRLEILRNGAVSQASDYQPPVFELKTNFVLRETQTAWYCVRLFGGDPRRQTAVSGAFFFHDPMFQPPAPVPARVQVSLVDAVTAQGLAGTVTEVAYHGPLRQEGPSHVVEAQGGRLTVPGTVRLRAQAPGYQPLTLSPFLDHPALVQAVTGLQAADLARWETFEQVRKLLGETRLVFRLSK